MASLVPNPKNEIHNGVTTTPPPIPPAVDKSIKIDSTIKPIISLG